ncbi:MAG TPA: GntR family transcriptional regulator [Haloplasmataceae bacterium]
MKPKYLKIYEDLLKKLENKTYDYGDMLPTEMELCKIYGTSRMTINKVIQMLQNEERVIRKRGKGTFVVEPPLNKDILKLTSFSEDMEKIGKVPGAKLIEYKITFDVDEDIKEHLKLDDTDFAHIIKRVRTADNEPIAFDIDIISSKIANKLDIEKLSGSIYSYLESDLNINIAYSDFTIKAAQVSYEVAKYLHLEVGHPILLVKHITYMKQGLPFEYCYTYYRADKYSLNIRAYR